MISIKEIQQSSVKFVIVGTLKILVLSMKHVFAMVVMVSSKRVMSFNDVATACAKGNAYRVHFWYMSKDDVTNIMNNSNLIDKMDVL